jgi:hypothetical protein
MDVHVMPELPLAVENHGDARTVSVMKTVVPGAQKNPQRSARRSAAPARPDHFPSSILSRGFGNRRSAAMVQAKLEVGAANDPLEKQADRVAERVVRGAGPAETVIPVAAGVSRKCDGCMDEDRLLQRKAGGGAAPASGVNAVSAMPRLGGGQTMPKASRQFFEPRFGGADFGGVRLHTGPQAAALAAGVNAKAFTLGRDIVFAEGQYRPGSADGDRLLAHELTHVLQQAAQPGRGVIQRTPGVDADDSWRELITTELLPGDPARDAEAAEAMERMRRTASGADLVNTLWRMFCGSGECRSNITVSFVASLPSHATEASGFFEPNARNQLNYTVWIESRRPRRSGPGVRSGGIDWPGGSSIDFHISIQDNASIMANTLYHELLHIWFLHARRGAAYRTGHGDVMQGEIEPEFLGLLRQFGREMETLEAEIHAEAERRQSRPPPQPEPQAPPPSGVAPPSTHTNGPSRVGFGLHGQGGVVGNDGIGAFGTTIFGADLILGNIASFNIGPRGLYLSPDHLLLGGAAGFRLRETEDGFSSAGRVTNPLFFDIDLGILAEVPVGELPLGGDIQFMLSPGIGQEFGRDGPRFYWRVGGLVLISNESAPTVLGGGTGGIGGRF